MKSKPTVTESRDMYHLIDGDHVFVDNLLVCNRTYAKEVSQSANPSPNSRIFSYTILRTSMPKSSVRSGQVCTEISSPNIRKQTTVPSRNISDVKGVLAHP